MNELILKLLHRQASQATEAGHQHKRDLAEMTQKCERIDLYLSARENFFASPTWRTRPTTGCGVRSVSLWVHREPLLATVKRRKLSWFGHVSRHDNLSKTILQGILEVGRHHGRQRKYSMDNVKEWTFPPVPELLTGAFCRKDWKRISAESSLMSPRRPNRLKG